MQYIIMLVVSFIWVKACTHERPPSQEQIDTKKIIDAKNAVSSRLKDPESARFSGVYVTGNIVCGLVNARNSFGGYAGDMRFVSAGMPSSSFLESDMKKSEFKKVWVKFCE